MNTVGEAIAHAEKVDVRAKWVANVGRPVIKVPAGNIRIGSIDPEVIAKYNLKVGDIFPFTHQQIVD